MKLVGTSRRLPIYLVADTSASMHGPAIEAVNTGLRNFAAALRLDPHALECAAVSVITFASAAKQLTFMEEAGKFSPPTLLAEGGTALGAVLREIASALNRDTRLRTPQYAGDWRPLIFLMTDGQPTDDWEAGLQVFQTAAARWHSTMIAIGCGPTIDAELLNRLTKTVMLMPDMTPDTITSLFEWISQSIKTASRAVSQSRNDADRAAIDLPAPPAGFRIVV